MTRAQQQERTRAAVLAAARAEFTERGYAEAKVDRIAERAELTRGAVYSNFPSKRALYLAVLINLVERSAAAEAATASPASTEQALEAFARVWLERLPMIGDTPAEGHLHLRSLTGVLDDEPARVGLAQVVRLEALLLALALEADQPPARQERRVRLAELVLTLLNGAGGFAETAPGFGDPFDLTRACAHLAGLDLADTWNPAHLPYVPPAQPGNETWTPPTEVFDQITGRPVDLGADGVIAVLGSCRLAAAEEAVRAAARGEQVTVVVVTNNPSEIGRLIRLRIADLAAVLRRVFNSDARTSLRVLHDDRAEIASALGQPDAGDATETAVRIHDGTIVARAEGRGASHAAATADPFNSAVPRKTGK